MWPPGRRAAGGPRPAMELLTNPDTWLALLTLTTLEIVLGIDNIVFISILAGKLPPDQRDRARQVGLLAAMGMPAMEDAIVWTMTFSVGENRCVRHFELLNIANETKAVDVDMVLTLPSCKPKYMLVIHTRDPRSVPTNIIGSVMEVRMNFSGCAIVAGFFLAEEGEE